MPLLLRYFRRLAFTGCAFGSRRRTPLGGCFACRLLRVRRRGTCPSFCRLWYWLITCFWSSSCFVLLCRQWWGRRLGVRWACPAPGGRRWPLGVHGGRCAGCVGFLAPRRSWAGLSCGTLVLLLRCAWTACSSLLLSFLVTSYVGWRMSGGRLMGPTLLFLRLISCFRVLTLPSLLGGAGVLGMTMGGMEAPMVP